MGVAGLGLRRSDEGGDGGVGGVKLWLLQRRQTVEQAELGIGHGVRDEKSEARHGAGQRQGLCVLDG